MPTQASIFGAIKIALACAVKASEGIGEHDVVPLLRVGFRCQRLPSRRSRLSHSSATDTDPQNRREQYNNKFHLLEFVRCRSHCIRQISADPTWIASFCYRREVQTHLFHSIDCELGR